MTHGSGIEVGRVSERDGTRHHGIRADGHAGCGRGKILLHHVVPLTVATAKGVCKTRACRKLLRAALDAAQASLDLTAWSARRRLGERALLALADIFQTPAERARRDDLAGRIRGTLAASGLYANLPTAA